MMDSVKSIYWRALGLYKRFRRIHSEAAGDAHQCDIAKQSPSWPFAKIVDPREWRRLTRKRSAHEIIEEIRRDMVRSLSGKRQQTWYRHEKMVMDIGECAQGVSSPGFCGRLLYGLIREFRPRCVVEFGSAFGIASMYIVQALKQNRSGVMKGIEYENWRADIANEALSTHWSNLANVYPGRVEDVFPSLVGNGEEVDFCFVDAVHRYEDCVGYHNILKDHLVKGAIVVYDDINWSADMQKFWQFVISEEVITDAVLVDGRWGIARYGSATLFEAKNA